MASYMGVDTTEQNNLKLKAQHDKDVIQSNKNEKTHLDNLHTIEVNDLQAQADQIALQQAIDNKIKNIMGPKADNKIFIYAGIAAIVVISVILSIKTKKVSHVKL